MTKTSLSIDREKADAALAEIVNMDRRRRLVERMKRSGRAIGPTDAELRRLGTP